MIYGLFEPGNIDPFYIGYTARFAQRFQEHLREAKAFINGSLKAKPNFIKLGIIKKIIENDQLPEYKILFETDSYEEILNQEMKFINSYGRRDDCSGCLANLTAGGMGGRQRILSEKEIIERRERRIGKSFDDLYGSEKSKEIRQSISRSNKGKSNWSKNQTAENNKSVKKKSESRTGKSSSLKGKKCDWIDNKGDKNPFFGKKHSPEAKLRMRLAKLKK